MEILSLTEIVKKDIPLHYRNEYTGKILYKSLQGGEEKTPIEFIVERSALGTLEINIEFKTPLDYPLVPALKSVKAYISSMDKKGELPW